jgi:DNA modification methylase
VLDQFAGSGTLLLAAEKVGRVAYAMEFEPRYVDVGILRWQQLTKRDAVLAGDGRTFEEITASRKEPNENAHYPSAGAVIGRSQRKAGKRA